MAHLSERLFLGGRGEVLAFSYATVPDSKSSAYSDSKIVTFFFDWPSFGLRRLKKKNRIRLLDTLQQGKSLSDTYKFFFWDEVAESV